MVTAAQKVANARGRARAPHHSRGELERWAQGYRERAGAGSELCVKLLDQLFDQRLLDAKSIDLMLELLQVLEGLSADPITTSCAMLHVAGSSGRDLTGVAGHLPAEVRQQLAELSKLKHFESD